MVLGYLRELPRHIAYRHANMSCGICALFGDSKLYRLDCILDDVDQRLADETRVATNRYRTSREIRLKGNIRMGGALQEHCLAHNFDQVLRFDHWRGHPCERGEFIDHAADIANMPNNRIGAHREGFRVVLDLLEISAPQPFCRQLDGSQRVLDLVRDATGDIGPGGLALSCQQFGYVVESDDEAADFAAVMLGRNADEQGAHAGPAGELHLRLG